MVDVLNQGLRGQWKWFGLSPNTSKLAGASAGQALGDAANWLPAGDWMKEIHLSDAVEALHGDETLWGEAEEDPFDAVCRMECCIRLSFGFNLAGRPSAITGDEANEEIARGIDEV